MTTNFKAGDRVRLVRDCHGYKNQNPSVISASTEGVISGPSSNATAVWFVVKFVDGWTHPGMSVYDFERVTP